MHDAKKPGRDWNHGEPDHEGEMAVSQLHRLNDMSEMLLDMISRGDDLPGWVQSKLTRAYNDLNDVFGYLEPQADNEMHSHKSSLLGKSATVVGEAKAKKGLWANIHARRKAGKRPKKPGEKGYPKSLDID